MKRLYSVAYALVNDYARFEALVDGGATSAGERWRTMSDALAPLVEARDAAAVALPRVVVGGTTCRPTTGVNGGPRRASLDAADSRSRSSVLAERGQRGAVAAGLPHSTCYHAQAACAPRRRAICSSCGSSTASARTSPIWSRP